MPFIDYTDHGDGSFSFHDDMGTTTPPMAGPAALQQKNKIDAVVKPMDPVPMSPRIRGERAELSPEMLEAGGEDLRTAALTEDRIAGMIKAPNGSIMDAGGAPRGLPPSASDAPLSVPGFENLIADEKTGSLYRRPPTASKSTPPPPAADPQTQKIIEDLDAKAGIPRTQPGPRYGTKEAKEQALTDGAIVPESDRVQISGPRQPGLQFAPAASGGGGSAPQMKEMKVGEATAFTTYRDEDKANLKRAQQNQYDAYGQLGEAQQKAGANMTGQLAEIPVGLTALEQERQQKEEHIAQRVQADHEHLDQLRQETRKDIDPNAFWKNKSAAEKFMGALAMGIGAYVQTMTGGQNNAMNILNSAIQTEIDAQKANKSASHQRFQDMRGQMAERKQLFADERQNFLAKKSAYLEQANSKLATYMQEAKTDEQKAQIADMQARVQQEAEKINLEFGKVSHQVQTKNVQTGGGAGAGIRMEDLSRGLVVQDLGGKKFLARSDKAAAKIQEVRPMTQTAIEAAKEMRTIANKPGFDKLDPTDSAVEQFNFARERFVNSMNSLMGQGVVKDDDIKRYTKEILGGPYGLATAKIADNFARQASSQFDQHFKANVDTETEVEERAEVDAKGVIKKGVHYNQQQLLTGQAPRGQVSFTKAGK
jgi:hypothetical protein